LGALRSSGREGLREGKRWKNLRYNLKVGGGKVREGMVKGIWATIRAWWS
jgi:hypothetical protein